MTAWLCPPRWTRITSYNVCYTKLLRDQELDFDQYFNEDVYVGYRYYHTFDVDVAYPFGHGLSYTTFTLSNSNVTGNTLNNKGGKGSVTLTTTVTNTGAVAGKEVAQVYISAPEVKLKKPDIELKAFAKTDKLRNNFV